MKMEAAFATVMRLPALFIIEYWYSHGHSSIPHSFRFEEVLNCVLSNLVLLHGFLLLVLPLKFVKSLYAHFLSGYLIFTCQVVSKHYINFEIFKQKSIEQDTDVGDDFYLLKKHILILVFHASLGNLIYYLLKGPWMTSVPLFSIYALPLIARLSGMPVHILPFLQNLCNAVICCSIFLYFTYQVPKVFDSVKHVYISTANVIETRGLSTLLLDIWEKLFVPIHFALFWLIELIVNFGIVLYTGEKQLWYITIFKIIGATCGSPIMLLATAVTISYFSNFILCSTRAYLLGFSAFFFDNRGNNGWAEGFTLVWLSFQSGLISMQITTRGAMMIFVVFIVFSTLMSSMLEITEPILLSLSTSRNRNVWKHFRCLSMCFMLFVFPIYITKLYLSIFPIDFWMLIILSNFAMTSIAVIDLLIVHSMFLYDSVGPNTWENLDDIVYYTRGIIKILEFLIAVSVVGGGLWESTLRTSMMHYMNILILMVHFYVNVLLRIQTGWKSFLLRREMSGKTKLLPSATEEQLSQLDDVCSICYGNMTAACITPCQHYFHRTCLRKWLYVQDKCPLCHSVVSLPTPNNAVRIQQVS